MITNLCVDLRFKLSISMLYVQKHAGGEIRGGERELLLEIQLLRRIQAFDRLLVRVQQRRARQLQTLQPVRRDAEDQESPIKKSARYSWAWQVLENPFTNLNYRSFLCRYFERKSNYIGDTSAGCSDFRHYNYRRTPYFGGSDEYSWVWEYWLWTEQTCRRCLMMIMEINTIVSNHWRPATLLLMPCWAFYFENIVFHLSIHTPNLRVTNWF